jgi:hypothetical protein
MAGYTGGALVRACAILSLLACDGAGPDHDGGVADRDGSSERDGGTVVDNRLHEGPICTGNGWCWETPLPAGLHVSGIWAPERGHAIGASSTHLMHIDPGNTVRHAAPPTLTPYLNYIPVWGAAHDDVWSMGFGSAIHFDGSEWSEVPGVSFASAMSGVARNDIWAVGFSSVFHYDGSEWSPVLGGDPSRTYTDVWAFGAGEAIVVGVNGGAPIAIHVRADGTTSDLAFPGTSTPQSVYASSAEDVWVGQNGTLYHLQSGTWTEADTHAGLVAFDMWGSGAEVWMTRWPNQVRHWNGAAFETLTLEGPRTLLMISGTANDDVWVSDLDGGMHHYDGASWTSHKRPLVYEDFFSVAASDTEAWAVSPQSLAHRGADGTWAIEPSPLATPYVHTGIAQVGEETFLFGNSASFRRSAGEWLPVEGARGLRDACALEDGTTLAVGADVARYEEGRFVVDESVTASNLRQVFCIGEQAWASAPAELGRGGFGTIFHYDDGAWARVGLVSVATHPIAAAFSSAAGDAWIVAGDPEAHFSGEVVVMRLVGDEWREVPLGGDSVALGVGGSSPSDVWIVGEAGLARHWNGTTLGIVDASGAPDFRWVHGYGDGTARAVARDGAVWEYSGSAWSEITPPIDGSEGFSSDQLVDLGFSGDEIFAAGESYEALRWTGGVWAALPGFFSAVEVEASDSAVYFESLSDNLARWNGESFEDVSVSGSGGGRLVLVGAELYRDESSQVTRLTGSEFVLEHRVEGEVRAFFGAGPDALFMIAAQERGLDERHEVWRKASGTWSVMPELAGAIAFTREGGGNVIAVGSDLAIYRREGGLFQRVSAGLEGISDYTVSAYVYSETDIWALALNGLLHFDGGSWTTLAEPVGIGFDALEGSPNGTLYAVGRGGSIVRRAAR